MECIIGKSNLHDAKEAVREAGKKLRRPKLIIFYSGVEQFKDYAKALKEQFPESLIIGATSYVVLCNEGAIKGNLVIMGIESGIECYGGVLENIDLYPMKYVSRIKHCVDQFSDHKNIVCMELTNSLSSEELVLTTLNSVLEDKAIPIFGGTAGNNGAEPNTLVSMNGEVYEKASVFVLIKNLGGRIRLYKEDIFKPTPQRFIATKVDVRNRIVYEYDGKPAAKVIAQALNTTVKELGKYLDTHPVGRVIGDEKYIVVSKEVTPELGIAYFSRIYPNTQVVLLEPDDYRAVNERTRAQIQKEIKKPSLTIMIHCLGRSMQYENEGYINEFAKTMGTVLGPYVGQSGYGEQLWGKQFNQTMVLAIFE